jgi:hypothetical protein
MQGRSAGSYPNTENYLLKNINNTFYMRRHKKNRLTSLTTLSAVLGTICVGSITPISLHAQSDTATNNLEKENADLRSRLDRLEDLMKKEGIAPSGELNSTMPVKALQNITISGFVTASYFYDVASSKDAHPTGYLWNTGLNQFTLNKAEVILQGGALDKDKWDATFFLSMLYGQDQPINDSSGGPYSAIRQAFIDVNIPIGTGLDLRVGEMTSLLNYESGDGGAVNDNFSQGYQWWYTGNGPAETVQLGYDFNDKFGVKVRAQNGLYNGEVGTGPKTVVGGLYWVPDKKTSLAFLAFAGKQDNIGPVYALDGGSFIGSRQLLKAYNLSFATEADFFHFTDFNPASAGFASGAGRGDFWSVGGWLTADIDPKLRIALRAELLDDPSGFGTIYNSPNPAGIEYGAPGFSPAIYTSGEGQELTDITLTLDYKPVPSVKFQPEIRWNHSTVGSAFAGKSDQVIVGMGVSYIF